MNRRDLSHVKQKMNWNPGIWVTALLLSLVLLPRVQAQEEEQWYDPTDWFDTTPEQPAEQEWYDPSDWFEDRPERPQRQEWYDPTDWFGQELGQQTLQGRIESIRRIQLRDPFGNRERHTIVTVRLQDGTHRTVDLGPNVRLDELDLQRGDRLFVRGELGTIDNRNVLMADVVRANGETRYLEWPAIGRPGQQQERGVARGQQSFPGTRIGQNRYVVRGNIADYSEAQLEDIDATDRLLNLELQSGQSITIDVDQLSRDRLMRLKRHADAGDYVTIEGELTTMNGQQVLVAEDVKLRPSR